MVMKFRSPGGRPTTPTKAPEVTGRPVDMNPRPGPRPGAAPAPRPATPSPTMISATPYQPSQRGSGNEQMGTPGMNQAPWHAGPPSPGASGYQNAMNTQQYGMNGMQGYQNAMNAMREANQRVGTNPPASGPQQGWLPLNQRPGYTLPGGGVDPGDVMWMNNGMTSWPTPYPNELPPVVSDNYNQQRAYAPGRPNPGSYRPGGDPNQRVGTNPPNPNPWLGRMPGTAPAPVAYPGGQPGGMPPVGGGLPVRTQPPRDPNLERFPTIRDVPAAAPPPDPRAQQAQLMQAWGNDPRPEVQNTLRSMQSAIDVGNPQQAAAMQQQLMRFIQQGNGTPLAAPPSDTLRGTGLPGDPNLPVGQATQASALPQNSPLMSVYQNAMAQGNMGLANAIREQMMRQSGFTSPG